MINLFIFLISNQGNKDLLLVFLLLFNVQVNSFQSCQDVATISLVLSVLLESKSVFLKDTTR